MVNSSHESHARKAWVVLTPAEDVPGEWVAHCLDLDVMSQGSSLAHAVDMMLEAIDLVVGEDRAAGLDPFDRRAPESEWSKFYSHKRAAELTTLPELQGQAVSWVATQLPVVLPEAGDVPVPKATQAVLVEHAGAAA